MKKHLIFVAMICASMVFVSCSSSKESAYRKAYEKAKAQEQAQAQQAAQPLQQYTQEQVQPVQQSPVVTPLVEAPAQQQAPATPASNVAVRSERVSVVSGTGLKAYSVIVGSFGVRANAEGLQNTLKNAGYNAQVAYNQERNMYRVAVATFDSRESAVQCKQSLQGTYPDAWLLMQQ